MPSIPSQQFTHDGGSLGPGRLGLESNFFNPLNLHYPRLVDDDLNLAEP